MCKQIGVDPLSSNKGFWVDVLGVGDFYYELAVSTLSPFTCFKDPNRKHLHSTATQKRWILRGTRLLAAFAVD